VHYEALTFKSKGKALQLFKNQFLTILSFYIKDKNLTNSQQKFKNNLFLSKII